MISEISAQTNLLALNAASSEQTSAAQGVSEAIRQVIEVTHRATAGSEEMASSSEQLGAEAGALRKLVHHFKTDARA